MPRMIPIISERAKTSEERLMLAVLLQQIQDTVNAKIPSAISYIFEDSQESEEYVFGFKHICHYFGYDHAVMREKIRELMMNKRRIFARKIRDN